MSFDDPIDDVAIHSSLFWMLYSSLFWILLPLVAVAAFRWGGRPERRIALLFLAAASATFLVRSGVTTRYHGVELALFTVDVLLLVGLACIAIRADRWWPIWATAFQAISVLSHVAATINPRLWRLGYELMAEASSYPTLITLALGTLWHHRRQGKYVAVISKGSSPKANLAPLA